MDKLAQRLYEDAQRIDARISPELEKRIDASLRAVTPLRPTQPQRSARTWFPWLAGGATVAVAVLAAVFVREPQAPRQAPVAQDNAPSSLTLPLLDLDSGTAELTDPLAQELENLQADLRRAERELREEIGF